MHEMTPCKYRVKIEKSPTGTVSIIDFGRSLNKLTVAKGLHSQFRCGLCKLLTDKDIGPVECRQPQHSEDSCPDIK